MELGEIRRVIVNVSGAAGVNAISGTPTATSDTLTLGTPSASGLSITFTVTADQVGTHSIIVGCELDSSETLKGFIRAKVVDSTICNTRDDY